MHRAPLCLLLLPLLAVAAPVTAHVTLYHFNIQYVAGGMLGFPDGHSHDPKFQQTAEEVEDAIVTQSFAPLLDVLNRHPSWHVDLELQGLMVEVMAARHPATLDLLRTLAKRGQVELISFQYSDQFFLAYPKRDLVRSVKKTRAVFQANDLPLSPVVFNQEGQFNEGMLKVMAEEGYSTAVMATNLYDYLYGQGPPSHFYAKDGVDVVITGGSTTGDLTAEWDGPGDGELIVTHNLNPYAGTDFVTYPADVMQWEANRTAEEGAGTQHLTVTELVALAKARTPFGPLPLINDGTWRPNNTHNLWRWMGGSGALFDLLTPTEEDNPVLTSNMKASRDVAACEAVIAWAQKKPGQQARLDALDAAARELMLAQVSDSTGWTPWLGEVNYSLDHAKAAHDAAVACIDAPELRGPESLTVDLATGAVTENTPVAALTGTAADAPFEVKVTAPNRQVTLTWKRLTPERLELKVDGTTSSSTTDRTVSLEFPLATDHVTYTPALDEGRLIDEPASTFAAGVEQTLSSPNGLWGIAPNRFLVKDTAFVHLAALAHYDLQNLQVTDETVRADQEVHWRFEVIDADPARALELATQLNVTPKVTYALTPKTGCGCQGTTGAAAWLLALLLTRLWVEPLAALRRLRRRVPGHLRESLARR